MDLFRRDRHQCGDPLNGPIQNRDPQQIADLGDPAASRRMQPADQVRGLCHKERAERHDRDHDDQDHPQREEERRRPLAPAHSPAQRLVRRKQDERKEAGPEQRAEERLENLEDGDPQQARGDEGKNPWVELAIGLSH